MMNLLFMGDSLIEYFDWQEGFPEHNVVNFGLSGETVEGLLARVHGVKDVCPHADSVFVMSGINNISMGDAAFLDYYRAILKKLSSFYPEADIYIHSLLPTRVLFIANETIRQVNEGLWKLAADTGVHYLDLYARFVDDREEPVEEYLLEDGVHLSSQGYEAWLSFLKEATSL